MASEEKKEVVREALPMVGSDADGMAKFADGWAALARARTNFKPVVLDKVNPHFRNKYASLAAVLAATLPALAAEGLALATRTFVRDGLVIAETQVVYRGMSVVEAAWPVGKADMGQQALGSALTYARRYTISAVLCVCADEDDDGEAAQGAANKAKGAATPAPF
jgi:hypothetical protein